MIISKIIEFDYSRIEESILEIAEEIKKGYHVGYIQRSEVEFNSLCKRPTLIIKLERAGVNED